MADDKKSIKLIIIALIWVFIAACIAVGYKMFIKPKQDAKVINATASSGSYKHTIDLHLDSFSGYALLRSPAFEKRLKSLSVRLNTTDDGADYNARIKALEKGEADMAVFTVDSFLAAGSRRDDHRRDQGRGRDRRQGGRHRLLARPQPAAGAHRRDAGFAERVSRAGRHRQLQPARPAEEMVAGG